MEEDEVTELSHSLRHSSTITPPSNGDIGNKDSDAHHYNSDTDSSDDNTTLIQSIGYNSQSRSSSVTTSHQENGQFVDKQNCHFLTSNVKDELSDGLCDSHSKDSQSDSETSSLSAEHEAHLLAFRKHREDAANRRKIVHIANALSKDPIDIFALRQLAMSRFGLLNNKLRRKAWPKLLNVNIDNIDPKPSQSILRSHRDYNQVVMDVNRSLKRFPPGMEDDIRLAMQDELVDVIMRVLVHHPQLHYFQGYHDICVTFLLVAGEDISFALVDMLSTHHLRDFLDSSMDRTKHMLNYLYPIIGKASPELRDYMEKAELGTIFCLPWLITWYGHVLSDIRHIVRLYDFFLACHPLMPIYLAAAIVLHREKEVLQTECDMAMIHCLLSKIPPDLPVEYLVSKAGDLYVQFPPEELANEALQHFQQSSSISNYPRFEQATMSQTPVEIPKDVPIASEQDLEIPQPNRVRIFARHAMLALTAGVGAAAYAAFNLSEWEWLFSR
ncbi:TBC1 domain family member 20-like [Tubulanus polymorphus]|uniref:TBC1 domain family member 20-like n=1 Tax=Tubulanus polymorphus TaxID=672921 RepID=UPI003DA6376B